MGMLKIIPWDVLFTVINLLVLYIFMRKFLFKPIKGVMDKRDAMIKESLGQAEESKIQAQAALEKRQSELEGVKDESAKILEQAKSSARSEYDRIVSGANDEAGRIIQQAQTAAASEHENALKSARSEIANLALDTVEKVLSGKNTEDINSSIYEAFISETGEQNDSK